MATVDVNGNVVNSAWDNFVTSIGSAFTNTAVAAINNAAPAPNAPAAPVAPTLGANTPVTTNIGAIVAVVAVVVAVVWGIVITLRKAG